MKKFAVYIEYSGASQHVIKPRHIWGAIRERLTKPKMMGPARSLKVFRVAEVEMLANGRWKEIDVLQHQSDVSERLEGT